MAKLEKRNRPKPRLPKGLRDIEAAEIRGVKKMLGVIESVYESYGFEPVETPMIEYTDALGKFLPDQDRPNEGVFSFQDDDDQWLSLRYDLTAPLARYVAENFQDLPKPYRSYRSGWVFRNEKPGPGRYRQFMQFDADTVGTSSPAADAEICMLAADTMEALGLKGQYVIKVSSRKVLDGIMEAIGLGGQDNAGRRLQVMRAIDKLDRLKVDGVRALLGHGREDESGDFTPGAGLDCESIQTIIRFLNDTEAWTLADLTDAMEPDASFSQKRSLQALQSARFKDELTNRAYPGRFFDSESLLNDFDNFVGVSAVGRQGVQELREILEFVKAAGYGSRRIRVDPTVVRGLEYYTGAVFEADLLFETTDEAGNPVRFGSVGGGGRYDDLVARFRGELVPATGFSIGVSRLYAALKALGRVDEGAALAPVVVLVMDRERIGDHQCLVSELRNAGIRAELYLGTSGMKAQMKYADKRGAPCVVIQGEDERAKGEVLIRDLTHSAQVPVPEAELVSAVKDVLARYRG